jgi:hypothetical protein
MSGQIGEAQVLNRAAIEHAWYALHIAKDPQPWTRAEIWLRRNEDSASKQACKTEFTVGNVRSTHAALKPADAKELADLYDLTIDFGAHPNQLGVLSSIRRSEDAEKIQYNVGILSPDTVGVMATIRLSVDVAVGVFKVVALIYPERFAIMSVDGDIDTIVRILNTAFKRFATTA